jgi:hypothetical protein
MALKLRKGTDAERLLITPASGELIYTTDTKQIFVGDGTTAGGVFVGPASSEALTLGGNLTLNGHDIVGTGNINIAGTITATGNINLGDTDTDNIVFGGEVNSNIIPNTDASYNLGSSSKTWSNGWINTLTSNSIITSTVTGTLTGDVKGSVFADDSSVLVDSVAGRIVGPVFSNVTGNLTGNVTGDVDGNLTGNVNGNVTGDVLGDLTGDVIGGSVKTSDGVTTFLYQPGVLSTEAIFVGTVSGNVVGSVFASDSTTLVDAIGGNINLNGTVQDDIVPAEDSVYDLGSNLFRFKDLYLSGTSINLGGMTLSNTSGVLSVMGVVSAMMPVTTTVASAPIPEESTDRFTVTNANGIQAGAKASISGASDIEVLSVNTGSGLVIFTENFATSDDFVNGTSITFYNPGSEALTFKSTVPASAAGGPGDRKGMIAADTEYLYVCIGNYDATTEIWQRIQFAPTPW